MDSTSSTPSEPKTLVSGPPELPYTLWTRKKSIAIYWTIMIVESCIVADVLYYPLEYATNNEPDEQ